MSIDMPLSVLLDEIQTLLLERHLKYGAANVAGSPGGPLNGLRVRIWDKVARLNNAIDSGSMDFEDDSFRDCWLDLVGYGLIGLLVLDGEWPGAVEKPLEDYIEGAPPSCDRLIAAPTMNTTAATKWIAPDWREAAPDTRRWSSLFHPETPDGKPDGWPVGTTFRGDHGAYTWRRGLLGWSAGAHSDGPFVNLRELVDFFNFADGTITYPTTEEKAA